MSSLRPRSSARQAFVLFALCIALALAGCRSDSEKIQAFMARGDEYREAGRHQEAIIEYRNALQLDPNLAAAHEGLAHSYLRTEQLKEGYWELSETIRLDPGNIDARLTYGTISAAAKRSDEVLEQAQAIVELDPDNAPGHLLLGQAYVGLERFDEAEAPLLRAVELQPDGGSYRAAIASYYVALERIAEAEAQIREGLARDPSPSLWSMLGQVLLSQERFDEAEAALQSGLASAREKAAAVAEGEPEPIDLVQSYQNLAAFYFQRDQAERGVATLREGIEASRNRGDLITLLARYFRAKGDRDAANELMVRATEVNPNDPLPFLAVSNVRGQEGDFAGALEYAEKAIAADPKHTSSRLRKAEILVDLGVRNDDPAQTAAGRALVDEVLAAEPTNPEANFVRAKHEIATGNVDKGIEAVRAALDTRPSWAQAHFVLGSALILKGELQRARAELARAIELEAGLIEARRLLIKVHADLGEHEYAIENGKRYLRARPEDDHTRIIVAQSMVRLDKSSDAMKLLEEIPSERRTVEVLFAVGNLQVERGNFAAARESLLAANELQPNNARILGALVPIDRKEGKLSHSIKRVNDAVEAKPDDPELWSLKGRLAMTAPGDPAAAESALKKAIELDPNFLAAYRTLAEVYAATGRTDETIALYQKAVEQQPENAGAHHFLGVLYEVTGQTAKAREQYEKALEYDPTLGESKNNLAYLMAEAGQDLDRALKLAQEAKAAMPDSANAADTLGWVLYKRGVASAAVGYLREAVQVARPDDPAIGEIRNHLSLAYEATGDIDKAIETLELALDDLERLRAGKHVRQDPSWAPVVRARIEQLKAASAG